MFQQFLYGAKYVLGLDTARNNLTVFSDDTFIVSYPKSGNTWTRFLIANLVSSETVDFSNINRLIPDPDALSKRYLKSVPRPRILKSHQPYDPRYGRVICIVRDPRDVALSQYHFHIKRTVIAEGYPIEGFVLRFVAGDWNPDTGSWGENVGSWVGARRASTRLRDPGKFLLLRYEDMIADPRRELLAISGFLGINATAERIAKAAERSSAERMREMEKSQAHLWSSTAGTRKDKPFVRAARAGGWRNELPAGCVAEIESAWGHLMKELGYELQSGRGEASPGDPVAAVRIRSEGRPASSGM